MPFSIQKILNKIIKGQRNFHPTSYENMNNNQLCLFLGLKQIEYFSDKPKCIVCKEEICKEINQKKGRLIFSHNFGHNTKNKKNLNNNIKYIKELGFELPNGLSGDYIFNKNNLVKYNFLFSIIHEHCNNGRLVNKSNDNIFKNWKNNGHFNETYYFYSICSKIAKKFKKINHQG